MPAGAPGSETRPESDQKTAGNQQRNPCIDGDREHLTGCELIRNRACNQTGYERYPPARVTRCGLQQALHDAADPCHSTVEEKKDARRESDKASSDKSRYRCKVLQVLKSLLDYMDE